MAKLLNNNNSKDCYKVVVATRKEFVAVMDGLCECHLCGDECPFDEEMYYIPVLNVVYCKRCYELWCMSAKFYKVDKPLEEKNLAPMRDTFMDIGCWED